MKISKEKARTIAIQLTESAKNNVEALHIVYQDAVRAAYMSLLPRDVKTFSEKYREWTKWSATIFLDGCGFNRQSVSVRIAVPTISTGWQNTILELTPKIADPLKKLYHKWQDAKKEFEGLKEETEVALINLGTTKRIEKDLPIAVPYLDAGIPQFSVPALNLTSLKTKLSKLQPKNPAA